MDSIAIIHNIIEEHKTKIEKFRDLERSINDIEIAGELDKSLGLFMPGMPDSKPGLIRLHELLESLENWLIAHFNNEEHAFVATLRQQNDDKIISDYMVLLNDHNELKSRVAHSKVLVTELIEGEFTSYIWQAKAYDMRAYISNTKRLVEAHAAAEEVLLLKLLDELVKVKVVNK